MIIELKEWMPKSEKGEFHGSIWLTQRSKENPWGDFHNSTNHPVSMLRVSLTNKPNEWKFIYTQQTYQTESQCSYVE